LPFIKKTAEAVSFFPVGNPVRMGDRIKDLTALETITCAQDKTRTCTLFTAPAPQAGVSTNSTTWAFEFVDLLIF
jgi:hypothetical protein